MDLEAVGLRSYVSEPRHLWVSYSGFVFHRAAALTTCSFLLVLNYMSVGVFHPGKLPRITGVLWKMLSEAPRSDSSRVPKEEGASQASWSRQGAVSWAGKGYSTS